MTARSWPPAWPPWQPQPGAEDPSQGGMTQIAAYDAGLTDDPGCWVQPIQVYWSPRLDPASPEYDPQFADQVAWEEPTAAEQQAMDQSRQPDPPHRPEPDAWPEPELPF
jgi:hypothetical protein